MGARDPANPVMRGAIVPTDKPNILVIWGDDIGISNLSCYSEGLMGYRTPNIDRIAADGVRFTDYYGEQSCTAGRAAFICGQNPIRTGLTKVGMPGANLGLQPIPLSRRRSRTRATQPGSSAKTTSAIGMSFSPPITASMSSSATSTISMPKRSPSSMTTRPSRNSRSSARGSDRVGSSTVGQTALSRTPDRSR